MRRFIPAMFLILAACGTGNDVGDTRQTTLLQTTTTAAQATSTPGSTAAIPVAPGADLRIVDLGPQPDIVDLTVTIEPGDLSALVYARSESFFDLVAVVEVVEPDGTSITDSSDGAFVDAFTNTGEVALLLPFSPDFPLQTGDYTITLATDGAEFASTQAVFRSGIDDGLQALDVVFWDASTDPATDGASLDEVVSTIIDTGDVIFAGNGLTIGEVATRTAPKDLIDRYSTLLVDPDTGDENHRELCRALGSTERVLQIVLVDFIKEAGQDDFVIEGTATGIPGAVLIDGAATGCVAVAVSPDPDEPERGIFERSTVIWHEVGHLLGLFHTTESDGGAFDLISDTPECTSDQDTDGDNLLDEFECESVDGQYLMFHDSDGLTLSDGQAHLLRIHPLLHPAP